MLKVKVNQPKVYIDGVRVSFEKLLVLCNCSAVELRRILHDPLAIKEAILER